MLTKRIIPCLDVKNGNVVKGIHFLGLKEVGDPVALAKKYYLDGADELVFLDISATVEKRKTMVDIVNKVAKEIYIPFTVGGGISTIEDVRAMLMAGADKVSLNSAAIRNPDLIKEASKRFGNQCIVLAVDAKRRKDGSGWNVYIEGGRKDTGIDCIEWILKGVSLGAGEILLTSMDADGTKDGFDLALYEAVSKVVQVPVIASGGCGKMDDFVDALKVSDAALAASIFHYEESNVQNVKKYLKEKVIKIVCKTVCSHVSIAFIIGKCSEIIRKTKRPPYFFCEKISPCGAGTACATACGGRTPAGRRSRAAACRRHPIRAFRRSGRGCRGMPRRGRTTAGG